MPHPQHQGFTFLLTWTAQEKLASSQDPGKLFLPVFTWSPWYVWNVSYIWKFEGFLGRVGTLPYINELLELLVSQWRCRHSLSIIYCYGSSADEESWRYWSWFSPPGAEAGRQASGEAERHTACDSRVLDSCSQWDHGGFWKWCGSRQSLRDWISIFRDSGPPSRGTYSKEKEGKERRRSRSW